MAKVAHTRRAQLTHMDGRGTGVRLGRVLGYRTAVPRCVRDGRLSCVSVCVCVWCTRAVLQVTRGDKGKALEARAMFGKWRREIEREGLA